MTCLSLEIFYPIYEAEVAQRSLHVGPRAVTRGGISAGTGESGGRAVGRDVCQKSNMQNHRLDLDALSWPSEATPHCHAFVVTARLSLPISFYLNVLEGNRFFHTHAVV